MLFTVNHSDLSTMLASLPHVSCKSFRQPCLVARSAYNIYPPQLSEQIRLSNPTPIPQIAEPPLHLQACSKCTTRLAHCLEQEASLLAISGLTFPIAIASLSQLYIITPQRQRAPSGHSFTSKTQLSKPPISEPTPVSLAHGLIIGTYT